MNVFDYFTLLFAIRQILPIRALLLIGEWVRNRESRLPSAVR
jgi:hypothetical protein